MNRKVNIAITLLAAASLSNAANLVNRWNEVSVQASLVAGEGAIVQSRTLAIVQAAIHDALNSIDSRYQRYADNGVTCPTASPEAAITAAAHDALVGALTVASSTGFGTVTQQTKAVALVDAEQNVELDAIADVQAKRLGISLGQRAAASLVQRRSNDLATIAQVLYTPGTLPGDWQPTRNPEPASPAGAASNQPAAQPAWGRVTPFVLRRSTQFEPDGPPRLSSRRYARDYNEVTALGSQYSLNRTDEQSAIARFWYENASAIWSRFARVLAENRHLDSWETARLLALVNLAMADGLIAGFQTKYDFNFWRPVTAIQAGDLDQNIRTDRDLSWSSFLNTPPHPDYPSAHAEMAGAAAEVFRLFFHTDSIAFTATSGAPFPNLTRSFTSFTQAVLENGDARVFAGIHFRSAVEDGTSQGTQIGRFVVKHSLGQLDRDGNEDDHDR